MGHAIVLGSPPALIDDRYRSRLYRALGDSEEAGSILPKLDSTQWAKAKSQLSTETQSELILQRLHWLVWEHKKAPSIDSLATKIDVDRGSLQEIISAYNDAIANGKEDVMKKEAEYCTPIAKPAFYNLDISAHLDGVQTVIGLTLGGLRVYGKSGLALRQDNTRIQCRYAAGRNAVGIGSNGYVSGLSIVDRVFSGRRAGLHAAKQ
ncbi:hypothetical protein DER46DRAFT_577331 [Fusarium sp. MPI-SDFR-AT-0072]|nr:hypothetical protein DER46DRAFT_577331 [Fusarium sp. MPI-SDFR-AT-0072]